MFDKIAFDMQLQIHSATWRFQNKKWMSIDMYIFF